MRIDLQTTIITLAIASAGTGAYLASPALRAHVSQQAESWLGWTEAARRADPAGFTTHVEQRLRADLEELTATRHELALDVAALVEQEKEQRDLLGSAEKLAEEFRVAYRAASGSIGFPASIRNADYTESEVVQQVSLLLAEADGYRTSLERMSAVREQAEERLEELTVRINSTEAQLASLGVQRGLLRAHVLTDQGTELLAQVNELLDQNNATIRGNPVRSVRELLAAADPAQPRHANLESAREFLAGRAQGGKPEVSQVDRKPDFTAAYGTRENSAEPALGKPTLRFTPDLEVNPIFQQK